MRTAVRCQTCGADAAGSAARWCGSCGSPLDVAPETTRERDPAALLVLDDELEGADAAPPPPLRSRLIALAAVLAVLGGLVAAQASREREVEARGMTARGDAARAGVVSLARIEPPAGELWSSRLAFPPLVSDGLRILPAADRVFVVDLGRSGGITAHDAITGEVLWNRRDIGTSNVPPLLAGDTLVLQEVGQRTVAVGPDGEVRWREARALGDRSVHDGALVEVTDRDLVVADAATGVERWRLDVVDALDATPQWVLPGPPGQILLVAARPVGVDLGTAPEIEEPLLAVIDAAGGEVIQTLPLEDGLAWDQQPLAADDDVLVTADVTDVTFRDLRSGLVTARFPHRLANRPLSVHAADGLALLLDASGTVVAIAPDGTWVWSQTATLPIDVDVQGEQVLVRSASRVTVVRASDGAILGGQPVAVDDRRGPAGAGGEAHAVRDDGELVRYGLDGGVVWRVTTPLTELAAPAAAPEGRIVVATGDGVSVHRMADGSRIWGFRTGRLETIPADELTTPVVTEGVIVVSPPASQPLTVGGIYALRLETGILAWSRLEDRPQPRGPLTLDRGLALASVGTELHGYDPDDGRRALAARAGDLRGPVAAAGGVIVLASPATTSGGAQGRTVRAVTRADRSVRWETSLDACSAPTLTGDVAVVGTAEGLVALDLTTGDAVWRQDVGPSCADLATSVDGDLVLALAGLHDLAAVDVVTGDVVWQGRLPAAAAASPVVAAGDLVVPLLDGRVIALDVRTGAPAWDVSLSAVPASAPIVVDGQLALLLRDGRLVALR